MSRFGVINVLAVCLTAVTVSAWFALPMLVEGAYNGNSWFFLNAIISGQDVHPLSHYLDIANEYLIKLSFVSLSIATCLVFKSYTLKSASSSGVRGIWCGTSLNTATNNLSSKEMSSAMCLWIGGIFFVGIFLRLIVASRGYNDDIVSYRIVADIMASGGNVYSETTRYNYGPIWFYILHGLDLIPWMIEDSTWALRWKVTIFLTLVDMVLSILLSRWYGWRAAILFLLNPISIIITGYHSQFSNLAVLLALVGARLLDKNDKHGSNLQESLALCVIGLSLVVKHVFFLFPLWLAFKQRTLFRKLIYISVPVGIFLISFLPFADEDGVYGIVNNVFLYRSFDNGPFWNGLAPRVLVDNFPLSFLFLTTLIFFGLAWRRISSLESALRYCVVVVAFSSAIANQYLAIPLAAVAVSWNLGYGLYSIIGGAYLVISGDGLHWPYGFGRSSYGELIALLLVGLILHTLPYRRKQQIGFWIKNLVTWFKKEVRTQYNRCNRSRNTQPAED